MAVPRTTALWTSWPQACMTPGFRDLYGRPVASWMGRASMSARTAIDGARLAAPEHGHDAGLGHPGADLEAERLEPGCDELGRLDLAVAELGVHVDESADLDDLALEFLDLRVDPPARFRVDGPGPGRQRGQDGEQHERHQRSAKADHRG